jgi:hypothetical protein
MTDGQSASLSWNKAPIWGLQPDFYYCQTVAGLLIWGTQSDERTGLSFRITAGPCQRSHSWVRVPSDSWPYFYCLKFETSLAWLRWRYSTLLNITRVAVYSAHADCIENSILLLVSADRTENISCGCYCCVATNCHRNVFTSALPSNRQGEVRLLFLLLRAYFEVSAVQQLLHGANMPQYETISISVAMNVCET